MFKTFKHKKFIIILFFLIAFFFLKFPVLTSPMFWDGIIFTNSAEWMSRNSLNPILPGPLTHGGLDIGHPPLAYLSLAVPFNLIGTSLLVAHLTILFFAIMTLYFTYKLGSFLYNSKVGILALSLLMFSPLFFAQSGIVSLDMALTAFTVMTIYFALKNQKILYLISAAFLVLSKESGILTIGAISVYTFIRDYKKNKKELLRNLFITFSPAFLLLAWFGIHWVIQDEFAHPSFLKSFTPISILRFINRIKIFTLDDHNWILTFLMFFSLINLNSIKSLLRKKNLILFFSLTMLIFLLLTVLFKIIFAYESYLLMLINFTKDSFNINEKNLHLALLNFSNYKLLFILFIITLIFFRKNLSLTAFKKEKMTLLLLTILFYILFFSWTQFMPRYFLPIYPLFYILGGIALTKLFKKKAYLATAVIILLFITLWHGTSEDSRGYILEKNMEYLDSIQTHESMADYIETNFPNATILTYNFMIDELRYPHLGYIKSTINPIDYSRYDSKQKKTDFTFNTNDWYYFQCFLKNQCDTSTQILEGQGDIRIYDNRYKEYLTAEDFDLFYYSPQSSYPKNLINLVEDFNLVLIKRFEKNGKYTELYATKQFLSKIQDDNPNFFKSI